MPQRAPDSAVALEARAEGDLPHAVPSLDSFLRLDRRQHVPAQPQLLTSDSWQPWSAEYAGRLYSLFAGMRFSGSGKQCQARSFGRDRRIVRCRDSQQSSLNHLAAEHTHMEALKVAGKIVQQNA